MVVKKFAAMACFVAAAFAADTSPFGPITTAPAALGPWLNAKPAVAGDFPEDEVQCTAIIVFTHGLGDHGAGSWKDSMTVFRERRVPHACVILPTASELTITYQNANRKLRAWFDIAGGELTNDGIASGDMDNVRRSVKHVRAATDRLRRALNLPWSRVVFSGFSQGAALAVHLGMLHPLETQRSTAAVLNGDVKLKKSDLAARKDVSTANDKRPAGVAVIGGFVVGPQDLWPAAVAVRSRNAALRLAHRKATGATDTVDVVEPEDDTTTAAPVAHKAPPSVSCTGNEGGAGPSKKVCYQSTMPVSILHGKDDNVVVPNRARFLHKELRKYSSDPERVTLRTFAKLGHGANDEILDALATTMRRWLPSSYVPAEEPVKSWKGRKEDL